MKTKPFDMQAALNGAPVVTRSGRKVLSVEFDSYPLSAKIEGDNYNYEDTFTVSGRKYGDCLESPDDLFMLDEEGGEDEN